jgi:hypothetical protein
MGIGKDCYVPTWIGIIMFCLISEEL